MLRGQTRRPGLVFGLACVVAAIGAGSGCGPGTSAISWVGEDPAVVRCTVSRRERMPAILLEVPAPALPTGLYARALDPVGLDDMGYARDELVCAALHAPTESEIERARSSIPTMIELYRKTSDEASRLDVGCACEIASALGVLHLVMACAGAPQRSGCQVTKEQVDALDEMLEPLREAIAAAQVPVLHWRLAGPTDRRGWFGERIAKLTGRHPLGSKIWVPGQAVPHRGNHQLLRHLLEVEDVVAVVQQDGGNAVLVAREVDRREIVLDYFAHPELHSKMRGLMAEYDNLHAQDYIEELRKPEGKWRPAVDVDEGNLIEVRRKALERVDEAMVASSLLGGIAYPQDEEVREEPPPYVDRVTVQAPFVGGGEALAVRLDLSEQGWMWASALPDQPLSPTLEELATSSVTPRLEQPRRRSLRFVGRGTPAMDVLFLGIHAFAPLMKIVEMEHPSTVQGKTTDFAFDLPTGNFAADLPTREGLRKLRTRLSSKPYRLSARLTPAADAIEISLAPR